MSICNCFLSWWDNSPHSTPVHIDPSECVDENELLMDDGLSEVHDECSETSSTPDDGLHILLCILSSSEKDWSRFRHIIKWVPCLSKSLISLRLGVEFNKIATVFWKSKAM